MSIIVEDGSVVAGANAYCSVADADAYHQARSGDDGDWLALDDDVKERDLIKATDYLLGEYRSSWKGTRVSSAQLLDWPRWGVYPDEQFSLSNDVVPEEVKKACAELALRADTADLRADTSVPVKEETVGPITIVYDNPGSYPSIRYAAIDRMLAPLLASGASGVSFRVRRG